MAKSRVRSVSRWKAAIVGVVLTAVLTTVYMVAPHNRTLESYTRDVFFWKARPREDVSPDITIVAIDDNALELIGRWPWSWRDLAGIIDSLSALGARLVVLDITFGMEPKPEAPQGTKPGQVVTLEDPVAPLREAIQRSGRTILTYALYSKDTMTSPLQRRMEQLLTEDPGLERADLAKRLDVPEKEIGQYFVTTLRLALEDWLARELPGELDYEAIESKLQDLFGHLSESEKENRRYLIRLAVGSLQRRRLLTERGTVEYQTANPAWQLVPAVRVDAPLVPLARAADSSGFANVLPDPDGTVRRIPLTMQFGEYVMPQLALQAAMRARGMRKYTLHRTTETEMRIIGDNGQRIRVPVGPDGQMVINWTESPRTEKDDPSREFRRLQIAKVYEHSLLLNSERDYHRNMAFVAQTFSKAEQRKAAYLKLKEAIDNNGGAEKIEKLRGELEAVDEPLVMQLMTLDPEKVDKETFSRLKKALDSVKLYYDHLDVDTRRRQIMETQLAEYVRDRICYVGMTATSLAPDLKPTPVHKQYPGVAAHAAITDSLLRGKFVREAGLAATLGAMIAVGAAVTILAGWLPTLRGVLASIALLLAYYALGLLLFTSHGVLMPLFGAWSVGVVSLLGVMTYRELTEGRNRRWITGVFKQYTSGKLVDALVGNPEMLSLGGQRREMTVYFCDIADFTSISERLDPRTLVAFLQEYLEEATDRLLDQDGTLDKYIGDAILAFFGAPVAMIDHAARCLRAALSHLRILPVLNQRLQEKGLLPEGTRLKIRIGISTGPMVVGNIGSLRRFDYTVIGDTVNVGARLEGANRFFATTVLLSGATREQVGDEFLLRRIGPVRMVGKTEPIEVYELLDDQPPGARDGLDDYHAAVKEFEEGWFNEAHQKFEQALEARPGDGPTLAYLERIDTLLRDGVQIKPGPWDMVSKG